MRCPRCEEEIIGDVTECGLCGTKIKPSQKIKWYFRSSSILIGFLLVGPFILPLVWAHPKYSFTTKIIITGIVLGATYFLLAMTLHALQAVIAYYKQLAGVL